MKYKLRDICHFPKEKIAVAALDSLTYISTENMLPNRGGVIPASGLPTIESTQAFSEGDVLVSNIRPYFKKIWQASYAGGCSNDVLVFRANQEVDPDFLYYVLSDDQYFNYASATSKGTKMPRGDKVAIMEYPVPNVSYGEQRKISSILKSLDKKIELNKKINHNLQQQVLAMYQKIFVDSPNDDRRICRADECFDISIGKTPPRKEAEWFKTVQADNIVWVSIADMGNCGLFIADSSEYLSPAAVKKFNVAIVPDNTVLLSFKLTVGRIAITDGWMTTNEAIAHFKTENKFINEYLYCYLKSYNFQTLGSTSSIATAVNSKIIKAMPFVVPTDDELAIFHNFAAPIFEKIKACQHENVQLTRLRDSLLPKLMNGEIDVSGVEL